jgi:1-acyl-sn-glycerol-3-phosphate acyltransferase
MFRELVNGAVLVGGTVAWSIPTAVVLPFEGGRRTTAMARRWAKMVTRLCGVEVRIEGHEQPLDAPAYLVMSKHSSHFDLLGIYASMPIDMRPVAKRELGRIPIFGWVLKAGAAIMIDRGDREKAKASIARAGETIRGGRSVLLFPEGTRSAPDHVAPLKKGPFHLAVEARVPVLPVAVLGSAEVLRPHDWKIHPGLISVRVGTPIPTEGFGDSEEGREALRVKVGEALEALMKKGHIPA